MKTSEAVAVARMFDEAGYDGIVCSDHLIYPRELSSPYPDSPTGKADVVSRYRLAGYLDGTRTRDLRRDRPEIADGLRMNHEDLSLPTTVPSPSGPSSPVIPIAI